MAGHESFAARFSYGEVLPDRASGMLDGSNAPLLTFIVSEMETSGTSRLGLSLPQQQTALKGVDS